MELSIRDWMLVIGVLLLLAVALDGYRRALRRQRNQVRLSRNAKRLARKGIDVDYYPASNDATTGSPRPVVVRDEPSPVVSAVVREATPEPASQPVKIEPTFSAQDGAVVSSDFPAIESGEENGGHIINKPGDEPVEPLFADSSKAGKKKKPQARKDEGRVIQPSLFEAEAESEARNRSEPQQIITLNVLASSPEGFAGEDLLHILLACDCRFGEMNIFHRYESENAKGKIQFSIVNIVEPGVFNLDDIKNFTTPGVSFFLLLPGPKDPIEAFDCMVQTAQCVVRNLGGRLHDEAYSTVTEQTLEHCRQRIRDFLKHQLVGI